ncbi:MAG: Ig-like domain-containing protein [Acidobacteriia bacterium]|nr:Ig-like domain-containing protein [Terriglobia bacterium]
MPELVYTPDADLRVHEEGAIKLICKPFQSHENGMPEWVKNGADAYARENTPESGRVIVIIFDHGRRNAPSSISCLDFVGMTSAVIEKNFRIWADPEAATRGGVTAGVQGGHGNGGKCYMTQMFDRYAMIKTVKQKKGSCYGVVAGSIKFGYIPDRDEGRDYLVKDMRAELEKALLFVHCPMKSLPPAALTALKATDGFTLITGVDPKGYGNRINVQHLISNLQENAQMIRTLELCKVFVVANGEVADNGKPLSLPDIKPMEGAETPRVIAIPATLKDPVSGQQASTTDAGKLPAGSLTLRTSDVSMRWSRKGRHNIIYKAQSGYIGFTPMFQLDVQSPYRDRIYGECQLDSLEPFKQNDRGPLAKAPLPRAVEHFISEQVQLYAKEFEAKERRRYDQEEKNAISKMNEALDRWKNRLLTEVMKGLWGSGEGTSKPKREILPTGTPVRIELTLSHRKAGLGVSFRPSLKFFDAEGKRIRPVPFRWVSDDNNVAMVDEDLGVITTFTYGETSIRAETLKGKLKSNEVPLEVARIVEINISPSEVTMAAGTRDRLTAVCRLANGEETSDVYLVWTEDTPAVASVSSAGLVYGFAPGQTKVSAGDDKSMAKNPAVVIVTPGEGRGKGDKSGGKGYPRVLVSGEFDRDPDTSEFVNFSHEDPPVAQRPQDVDRNVWWINSSAPLAKLYLAVSKGYGHESREWRMYHIERIIDVMVQIALTQGPSDGDTGSPQEWILKGGMQEAEIQAAAAADLGEFIATGELPPEDAWATTAS